MSSAARLVTGLGNQSVSVPDSASKVLTSSSSCSSTPNPQTASRRASSQTRGHPRTRAWRRVHGGWGAVRWRPRSLRPRRGSVPRFGLLRRELVAPAGVAGCSRGDGAGEPEGGRAGAPAGASAVPSKTPEGKSIGEYKPDDFDPNKNKNSDVPRDKALGTGASGSTLFVFGHRREDAGHRDGTGDRQGHAAGAGPEAMCDDQGRQQGRRRWDRVDRVRRRHRHGRVQTAVVRGYPERREGPADRRVRGQEAQGRQPLVLVLGVRRIRRRRPGRGCQRLEPAGFERPGSDWVTRRPAPARDHHPRAPIREAARWDRSKQARRGGSPGRVRPGRPDQEGGDARREWRAGDTRRP